MPVMRESFAQRAELRVNCEAHGQAAGLDGLVDSFSRGVEIAMDIELLPEWAFGGDGDFGRTEAGAVAHDHRDAGGGCAAVSFLLTLAMEPLVTGRWGNKDRGRHLLTQHLGREIHRSDIPDDVRYQRDPIESLPIAPERVFAFNATGDVVVGRAQHLSAGHGFELEDAGDLVETGDSLVSSAGNEL